MKVAKNRNLTKIGSNKDAFSTGTANKPQKTSACRQAQAQAKKTSHKSSQA